MPLQRDPTEEVTLRITLAGPPAGVHFALQRGKDQLVDPVLSAGRDLVFTVPVRVKPGRDGQPDFAGPYVQGPPGERFVYVCSGVRAGDAASAWDRRAKVPLGGITADLLERSEGVLSVRIPGRAKDEGPVCAGVKLTPSDWTA